MPLLAVIESDMHATGNEDGPMMTGLLCHWVLYHLYGGDLPDGLPRTADKAPYRRIIPAWNARVPLVYL